MRQARAGDSSRYSSQAATAAPVVVEEVVHRPGLATYCCKGFWPERVRWVDASGARRTGKRRLARPEHLEWLAWRGMQGLTDLTFLYGVRRRGGRIVRSP